VWATSRSEEGQAKARALGAHWSFPSNEPLPRKVRAVIDNIGSASWSHSISWLARGGTLVTTGGTTGFEVSLNLLPLIADQLTVTGSIMGTLDDMERMIDLIARTGIKPEIGALLPMERAEEAFRDMWAGKTIDLTQSEAALRRNVAGLAARAGGEG
jgi:D-arabinose 1-dehydrogenase-like Zn-dependent alcohol dehydrogenase